MTQVDPSFTALPYRQLADAALQRARDLGASHADFRFERVRYQHLGVRDGVLQGASDSEDVGFAVRVIHQGAWGFASGVVLTPEEAVRVAETAVAVATVAAAMTSRPVELAPEPVHGDVTWISSYDVNPLEVPTADKVGAAGRLDQPAPHACGGRARDGGARAGPGEQVLRRPERHQHDPAAHPPPADLRGDGDRRGDRRLRLDVEHRPAGRSRLGVPHRRALGLGLRDRRGARTAGREAEGAQRQGRPLRPGDPSLQPVAHDPRVHRPRHRARPGPGLRGQLRRFLVRDLRQAQHPAVRLPRHERHRRPHGRERTGHRRVRRRGRADPAMGHHQGRCPRRLPARPGDGPHEAGAQRRPLQRLRLRRLSWPHPHPADGQRVLAAGARRPVDRGADRPRRARPLHHRRQVVVDRHAAVQLPVHRSAVPP